MTELAAAVARGERLATARAITLVEDEAEAAVELLEKLHGGGATAWRVGVTGPPGAGKSTLVASLLAGWRKEGARIAVVAVDPTSPFTGGALLGDRVRMSRLATDPEVFIRSMASRGSLGGLARRTSEVVDVLAAAGHDPVLIETVGVGQTEVDIAGAADTTVVVLSPESGDGVQTMKAGLMEIADVFCINKADREGAHRLVREVEMAVDMAPGDGWRAPVIQTVATRGEGLDELRQAMRDHRAALDAGGLLAERRRRRVRSKIRGLVEERVLRTFWNDARAARLDALVDAVVAGEQSPYAAARGLAEEVRDG